MRIRTCLLLLLTGTFIIGNFQIAFGNGRIPPQTSGASPLKAICSKSEGEQLEIFRVRLIDGDDFDGTLKVTVDGVTEEFSLNEVSQLKFFTKEINSDGFMKVEISRTDTDKKISAMVQVRSGDTTIRLSTDFRISPCVNIITV